MTAAQTSCVSLPNCPWVARAGAGEGLCGSMMLYLQRGFLKQTCSFSWGLLRVVFKWLYHGSGYIAGPLVNVPNLGNSNFSQVLHTTTCVSENLSIVHQDRSTLRQINTEPEMGPAKRKVAYSEPLFRFHVSFPECSSLGTSFLGFSVQGTLL